ncbi:hypothetical protein K439DRAFT_696956 [Ramaria rubella]|nr:hypothetical protein K439DRAFT_696956 [Ramaria rubella]
MTLGAWQGGQEAGCSRTVCSSLKYHPRHRPRDVVTVRLWPSSSHGLSASTHVWSRKEGLRFRVTTSICSLIAILAKWFNRSRRCRRAPSD